MLIVNLYLLLCTEQFRSNPKRIRWVKMTLVERMVIRSNLRVAALSYSTQFQFLLLLSIQKLQISMISRMSIANDFYTVAPFMVIWL